jgi:hypothetical protein
MAMARKIILVLTRKIPDLIDYKYYPFLLLGEIGEEMGGGKAYLLWGTSARYKRRIAKLFGSYLLYSWEVLLK